jgi:outer membrane protein insertion porin family
MPFPGSGQDRSLRWFGFLDGGQVYQEGEKMRISQLRYSAGLGSAGFRRWARSS